MICRAGIITNRNFVLKLFIPQTELQLHDIKTGKMIKKFDIEIGTLSTIYSDWRYKDVYIKIESYLSPGITYYCDLSKPPFELTVG